MLKPQALRQVMDLGGWVGSPRLAVTPEPGLQSQVGTCGWVGSLRLAQNPKPGLRHQVDMGGWVGARAALPRPARVLLGWSAAWHALVAPMVRRDASLRDRVRLQ